MKSNQPVIECVPNFSEGQNEGVIEDIAAAIRSVDGVLLLNIDPGYAANRTVMTFIGSPEAVCEAAFRAMAVAAEKIDMRQQQGTHPRFGSTDVCPLIPIENITLEETVAYAHQLARRVGEELDYPVYCYEAAALQGVYANLAKVRKGEYEGLKRRLESGIHPPDFGPAEWRASVGASAIGARDFLIAYNVNLATANPTIAQSIAREVRESGYIEISPSGEKRRIKGMLAKVKAIGWYIEEYGCAQVSMNLVEWKTTGVQTAYEAIKWLASKHGVGVTGSELVGLIPLEVLLDASSFYSMKEGITSSSEEEQVALAVRGLGLDDLKPFSPDNKIIEYRVKQLQS